VRRRSRSRSRGGKDKEKRGKSRGRSPEKKGGAAAAQEEVLAEAVTEEVPRKAPDPALVAKGKELRSRLTPEQRDAIEKWINMSETDKKGLMLLNLLVFIMVLGVMLALAAFLIIHFEINVFSLDTWRNLPETMQKVSKAFNNARRQGGRASRPGLEL